MISLVFHEMEKAAQLILRDQSPVTRATITGTKPRNSILFAHTDAYLVEAIYWEFRPDGVVVLIGDQKINAHPVMMHNEHTRSRWGKHSTRQPERERTLYVASTSSLSRTISQWWIDIAFQRGIRSVMHHRPSRPRPLIASSEKELTCSRVRKPPQSAYWNFFLGG